MQAYAYKNVISGHLDKAGLIADKMLDRFDDMVQNNRTDAPGYWQLTYYAKFVAACEKLDKESFL
jgi:hypothetical protein